MIHQNSVTRREHNRDSMKFPFGLPSLPQPFSSCVKRWFKGENRKQSMERRAEFLGNERIHACVRHIWTKKFVSSARWKGFCSFYNKREDKSCDKNCDDVNISSISLSIVIYLIEEKRKWIRIDLQEVYITVHASYFFTVKKFTSYLNLYHNNFSIVK